MGSAPPPLNEKRRERPCSATPKPKARAARASSAGHGRRPPELAIKSAKRCVAVLRCSYARMESASGHNFDWAAEATRFSE
jgi:hypothetical protein